MMGVGVKVAGLDSPGPSCASVSIMVGLVQRLSGLRNLGCYSSLCLHVLRAMALGFDSWGLREEGCGGVDGQASAAEAAEQDPE